MAYNGSSAFLYEQTKNITSPSLRITLKQNSKLTPLISLGSGDLFTTSDAYAYKDVINFQGKLVLFGNNPSDADTMFIKTFLSNGSSVSSITLGNSLTNGQFISVGNTVHLYYTENSQYVRRVSSGGSFTSWGASTLIFNGATNNSVVDVGAVSDTECYIMRGISPTSVSNLLCDNVIVYINNSTGVSRNVIVGGVKTLTANNFVGNLLTAKRLGDVDVLLTNTIKDTFGYDTGDGDHVKVYFTDTLNVYGGRELYNTGKGGALEMTNIVSGPSYSYIGMLPHVFSWVTDGGVTQFSDTTMASTIVRTSDFINFSNPISFAGITSASIVSAWIPGSTADAYELIFKPNWNAYTTMQIMKGDTGVDISNYVINYSNSNNERISLTLANAG